jgi:hypothetical protein
MAAAPADPSMSKNLIGVRTGALKTVFSQALTDDIDQKVRVLWGNGTFK